MKTHPMKARIRNDGGTTRIDVFDDIGAGFWSDGVTPASFAAQLSGVKGPLDVHISSSGGDVFDGLAIAEAIRSYGGPVTTVVDGIAASIASVIAQAGQKRVVAPGAMLMIHDAFAYPDTPNEAGLLKMAATVGKVSDNLAEQYAARAGGTPEQWRQAMQAETWYTADEAVAAGLADEVSGQAARLPASVDVESLAARAPGRIMAALRSMPQAAAPGAETPVCRTCEGRGTVKHPSTGQNTMQCPGCQGTGLYDPDAGGDGEGAGEGMELGAQGRGGGVRGKAGDEQLGSGWVKGADGKVRFDPDGDGDDDSTPEGDTDHDYFNPDGSQKKPVPPCPVPRDSADDRLWAFYRLAVRDAGGKVDNSPWDGPKAMSAGADSDDPAAFYAGICAGKKDGNPATQGAWALPYRYEPGGPPNAAGVKAALGRLPQTEGLMNEAEAKKTLQAAMKVVNPDYEPEDSAGDGISGAVALEQIRSALKGARA